MDKGNISVSMTTGEVVHGLRDLSEECSQQIQRLEHSLRDKNLDPALRDFREGILLGLRKRATLLEHALFLLQRQQ